VAGVLDTSFLFALLVESDAHHQAAHEEVVTHTGIEIPPAVLAEAEMLIRKRNGRRTGQETLTRLLSQNPHIGIMDADLHPSALRIWTGPGGLSYVDAHAVAGALLLDADLLTFDAAQKAAWRTQRRT
jgi:predicted nucleic acid-binding protein